MRCSQIQPILLPTFPITPLFLNPYIYTSPKTLDLPLFQPPFPKENPYLSPPKQSASASSTSSAAQLLALFSVLQSFTPKAPMAPTPADTVAFLGDESTLLCGGFLWFFVVFVGCSAGCQGFHCTFLLADLWTSNFHIVDDYHALSSKQKVSGKKRSVFVYHSISTQDHQLSQKPENTQVLDGPSWLCVAPSSV